MPAKRGKLVPASNGMRAYTRRVNPTSTPQRPRTRRVWGASSQLGKVPVLSAFAKRKG